MNTIMFFTKNRSRIEWLESVVMRYDEDAMIHIAYSLEEAYMMLQSTEINLFIIETGINDLGLDGLELAKNIREIRRYFFTEMIIISNLVDEKMYAYSKLHCYAYYEIPYDKGELEQTLMMLLHKEKHRLSKDTFYDYCFLKDGGSFYSVRYAEIIKIYCRSRRTDVLTSTYELSLSNRSTSNLLNGLSKDRFVRCNRNEIINIDCIKYVDIKEGTVSMINTDKKVYLSKGGRKEIMRIIDIINLNNKQ